ncbi:uncharacterized protein LOC144115978 [Amblyomma americanum]
MAAVDDTAHIVDGCCECPAGKLACNHLLAVLRTIMLLQSRGFTEAPDSLACTDLPQQWRVPRGSAVKGCSVQSVDWRSVKEGGRSTPRIALPKERRVQRRTRPQQKDAKRRLALDLLACDPDNDFAKGLLLTDEGESRQSRFGVVSSLSPQSYQMSLVPHGFDVLSSGLENAALTTVENIPAWKCFEETTAWLPPAYLNGNSIVQEIIVTTEAAKALERNTRQQAKSAAWQKERKLRLTSSKFGHVMKRKSPWTTKGLENITASRELSRVPAVNYGVKMEAVAAQRYEDVLRKMGHAPVVTSCGLLVNPDFPWLGASPDMVGCLASIVYDSVEGSYGAVEIKCPYSLRDCKAHELLAADFCSSLIDNVPHLKRDHDYFYQFSGQMGISQLGWGDFVVFGRHFILIERIRFEPTEWKNVRRVLDEFYFTTLLPYLSGLSLR